MLMLLLLMVLAITLKAAQDSGSPNHIISCVENGLNGRQIALARMSFVTAARVQ